MKKQSKNVKKTVSLVDAVKKLGSFPKKKPDIQSDELSKKMGGRWIAEALEFLEDLLMKKKAATKSIFSSCGSSQSNLDICDQEMEAFATAFSIAMDFRKKLFRKGLDEHGDTFMKKVSLNASITIHGLELSVPGGDYVVHSALADMLTYHLCNPERYANAMKMHGSAMSFVVTPEQDKVVVKYLAI